MAKEKNSGAVILRNTTVQAVANTYIQASLLTGLANSGNDALLVKEIAIEFPSFLWLAVGILEMEVAICRASKIAMPNIFDDDVLYKYKYSIQIGAASIIEAPGIVLYVPVSDLVVIEDTVFVQIKTLNVTGLNTFSTRIIAQPATVTESEKVGILLTRLN